MVVGDCKESPLMALGGCVSSGLLDWTSRLGNTAQMVSACLLGGGFFLTLTTLGMLFVHKWLSE